MNATRCFVAAAVLLSGLSSLTNQVVWQRGLKVFLGNSETTSSMVVVLVFMAGLGCGSIVAGRRASRANDPLLVLSLVEFLLCAVNLCVWAILDSDLEATVHAFNHAALLSGVPLGVVYTLLATGILTIPCMLMGATTPLAAEGMQRQLGYMKSRSLGLLFFTNTAGAVLGVLVGGVWLLPGYGQTVALLVAVSANCLSGVLILAGRFSIGSAVAAHATSQVEDKESAVLSQVARKVATMAQSRVLALLALLGMASLAYEMFLFRVIPLIHAPLPYTFSAVLCGFLLWWSIGAALEARVTIPLRYATGLCALMLLASLCGVFVDRGMAIDGPKDFVLFLVSRSFYFAPCALFGYTFSALVGEASLTWGRAVGIAYAWNTIGSCAGVVLFTVVGNEYSFVFTGTAIIILVTATLPLLTTSKWVRAAALSSAVLLCAVSPLLNSWVSSGRAYFGRDGVVTVDADGAVSLDGLWHSALSRNGSHIGSKNWYVGIAPVIAHPTGDIRKVSVIGMGIGITTATIAKHSPVERIDAYEINRTLQRLLHDLPRETLDVASNPKVRILWRDARTGLSLSDERYDVIQSSPLYLKQAGASLLNSREFFELVRSRLEPDGIFSLYSNGTPEQALALRKTAASVFPHYASLHGGYQLLLSNVPIDLSPERLALRYREGSGELWDEIRAFRQTVDPTAMRTIIDSSPLDWGNGGFSLTDDWPIIEYPGRLARTNF